MKSKAIALMLGLIACVSALAVEMEPDEVESKVDKAFKALLMERHSPLGRLQCWAGRLKRNLPVSDEVLLGVMTANIRQARTPPGFDSNSNLFAGPYVAARMAGYAFELYPGNPHLEATILDSIREAEQGLKEDSSLLNKVANFGSDELVWETRGLITDSRRLELFDREVERRSQPRFERNRFPEGIGFENWVEQRTSRPFLPQAVALLLIYSAGVWFMVFITRGKWPRTQRIGTLAILLGLCLAALWPWLRGIRWNPKSDDPQIQVRAVT
ncbi:MAG: hypothetical protein CFE26_13840 [Verrucomicrobiales bacterium VVV1]|nr:MAG: hypothetical protein CFE26_13840 [Verrucomicrobiales bacterium VVV1]